MAQPNFRTPNEIPNKIYHSSSTLSLKMACDFIKKTDFTDFDSIRKFRLFSRANNRLKIPVGSYVGKWYFYMTDTLKLTDTNWPMPTYQNYERVDIIGDNGEPDPRLRLIYPLGQLFTPTAEEWYDDRAGFCLVINVVDSSIWILYEFINQENILGVNKGMIGLYGTWGQLGPSDIPFSAAKIADSFDEWDLGDEDWLIDFEPEDTIQGGPGKVHIYLPEDNFLAYFLPKA